MPDDVAHPDEPVSPAKRGRPKPNALASKIKKLMQSSEDVGKIAQATPALIGRAMELFLAQLVQRSAERATQQGGRAILPGHIKLEVADNERFDFLRELEGIVAAPDPPPPVEKKPQTKRQRKRTVDDETGIGADDAPSETTSHPKKKQRKPRASAKPTSPAKSNSSGSAQHAQHAQQDDVSDPDFDATAEPKRSQKRQPQAKRPRAVKQARAAKIIAATEADVEAVQESIGNNNDNNISSERIARTEVDEGGGEGGEAGEVVHVQPDAASVAARLVADVPEEDDYDS